MLPNKRRKFLAVAAVTAATMGLPWKSFGARSGNRAFVSNTEDDGNVKHFGAIGDGKAFRKGRDVAASVGVVPRQHSSGGKDVLLGISKRDDANLRKLLIHGARALADHAFATALDQHGELDRAGDGARVRTG